jgi:hypothetical protein
LSQSPKPQADLDPFGEQPINDLEGSVRKAVVKTYREDILRPQVEQTNRVYGELSDIQSDEDFALVGTIWDTHWQSPQTQHRVMTGQTSPKLEYDKVVKTFYRESLKKTHGALKNVMDKKATPPHVEVGDQSHVHMPTATEEQKKAVEKITKSSQGGDQDIENLVKALLPADDPMFK